MNTIGERAFDLYQDLMKAIIFQLPAPIRDVGPVSVVLAENKLIKCKQQIHIKSVIF